MEKKKIYSSLARRIILVLFVLIVIPLIIYGTILFSDVEKYEGIIPHFFFLFLLILGVGGLGAYFLIKRMSRPLDQLYKVMNAVASGEEKRYQLDPFGFEINVLGNHFNDTVEALISHMEEAKNERVKKEVLAQELQVGHELQKELLPKELPKFPGFTMGSAFVAAKEIGGDFYDLFQWGTDHFFLVIADGSDKGISACLYALMVRSMLRSFAHPDLGQMIAKTNELFCLDTKETGNFVTAWVGVYDVKKNRLSYTSAGHPPGFLLRDDSTVEELMTQGIALGADAITDVEIKTVEFSKGDLIFLYTDGVIEAKNQKGDLFKKSRLCEFLAASRTLDPQGLIDRLIKQLDSDDDLAILSLKKA